MRGVEQLPGGAVEPALGRTPFPRPTPQAREFWNGVEVGDGAWTPGARRVLPRAALRLVGDLHRELDGERRKLLADRRQRQARYDAGALPGYLQAAEHREASGSWRVAALPEDMRRRRVEITGPINDPKMVINMLTRTEAGDRADVAMLDFEDSMKPSWENVISGLENLIGAADGTLEYTRPGSERVPEKRYALDPGDMPLLMVRVRGLHLTEANVTVDGRPVSAGLFDLAMSVFHSARRLLEQGRTPAYYVPKCEHFLEARWWSRLFGMLEEAFQLHPGTLRATFLIETLPAAYQVEEILYEIRERAAALNVGRWDKIFSDIKSLGEHSDRVLADRGSITMERPWMRNYALRLIDVCHRRGALAIGGMAAFTPGRTESTRATQRARVVEDKRFESALGHDGCWVSHPYFIGAAMEAFPRENQLDVLPSLPAAPDLLPQATGPRTLTGLRRNVRVGIAYLRGWNDDIGCIAWDDLMEDLATLEISRAQVWQWLRHGVQLDDGGVVDRKLVERIFAEELERMVAELHDGPSAGEEERRIREAGADAMAIFTESDFRPFLTCSSDEAGMTLLERRARLREGAGEIPRSTLTPSLV